MSALDLSVLDLPALAAELAPAELHVIERADLALTAFIALDDLRLGPACGGIRWRAYPTPADGVRDVLRPARAMTYKNALAELGFGGGKSVVLKHPEMDPERAFPVLGELIELLAGRYVTACDYGTTATELALVTSRTKHVLAEPAAGSLDRATAAGVMAASRAIWQRAAGTTRLAGVRVVVQGVGDVGLELVRLLVDAGAEVAFSEIDEERAEMCCVEVDAARIDAARIFDRPMDLFAVANGLYKHERPISGITLTCPREKAAKEYYQRRCRSTGTRAPMAMPSKRGRDAAWYGWHRTVSCWASSSTTWLGEATSRVLPRWTPQNRPMVDG